MITPVLYLVPTPIGNLGDITLRAIEVLKSVEYIFAEDTRKTKHLLNHFQIKGKKLFAYHKFNERSQAERLIAIAKKSSVAIVSDAGTPGISDPCFTAVRLAKKSGIKICPLPGASALLPALTASGFSAANFFFVGFLPQKASSKKQAFKRIVAAGCTSIFYEAPHRIYQTLEDIFVHLGEREVVIARELTKVFETFYSGNLSEFLDGHKKIHQKGEFVIVVEKSETKSVPDSIIRDEIERLKEKKLSKSTLSKQIAQRLDISKNRVYKLIHKN